MLMSSVQNGVLLLSGFGKVRTKSSLLNTLPSVLLGNSGDFYFIPLLVFKTVPLPRSLCSYNQWRGVDGPES